MQLDGYVRVSQVRGRGGDSFISPAQQRERIEAWMRAYGHERLEVFEELDESGARSDRPKLLRAIERVERGESDGIVVARLDRFGRSLVDGLQLIDRIREAGGTFASVQDGFDLSTDTGRLVLRIMLSLAEFELDRVRANWSDAKARAIMRGIHPSPRIPFGYRREGSGGPLVVDEHNGPIVSELFHRRAREGASYTELARWLNTLGVTTSVGRTSWALRGVKQIVRNRVYLGIAFAGETENPDAHAALTDRETWHAAQRPGQRTIPRSEHPSPLSGLMRCAGCRYVMRAERRARLNDDVWLFSCRANSSAEAWRCPEPAHITITDDLEAALVEAFLDGLPEFTARAHAAVPGLDDAAREADAARDAFVAWRDDVRIQARLGMDAYLDGLGARKDRLNLALAALAAMQDRAQAVLIPRDVSDLEARWSDLTSREQRELLQAAVTCVMVRRDHASRRMAPLDRLRLLWRGTPVELPRKGHTTWTPEPFRFVDVDGEPGVLRVAAAKD